MIPPPVLEKHIVLNRSHAFLFLKEISPLGGGIQKKRRGKQVVG